MNFAHSIIKLFLGLSTFMFCLGGLAAPMQIFVSANEGVHPETGQRTYSILNPSGDIDVTFIRGGLQITYKDKNDVLVTHKFYADFRKKEIGPEEDQRRYRFERIKFEMAQDQGIQVARGYLNYLSNTSKEQKNPAVLFLNPQGQLGFAKFDHVFSNIYAVVGGSNPISFEDIVYNYLRPTIDQIVENSFRAETPRKNPMGFISEPGVLPTPNLIIEVKAESQCAGVFLAKGN